jgi:hypothetical protein
MLYAKVILVKGSPTHQVNDICSHPTNNVCEYFWSNSWGGWVKKGEG